MFVTCNTLWTTLLNKAGMTTQAQKDAFCDIVKDCLPAQTNEVISGLVAPTAPPTNGEKVVVVQGAAGQPNQSYFWTGSQWLLMGDGAGLSGITLGTGGNVTLTGNGTAGSPLVGSVTLPTPVSTCTQILGFPAGVVQEVAGHDATGACVRETVVVAPTLCQEIAALPAGAIATVVGRDAAGNCVTGTVSGGSAPAAATDTVAGIAALNLGTNLPADATNATDSLTASGLAAILQQAGGNALTSAVCAATANCGGGGEGWNFSWHCVQTATAFALYVDVTTIGPQSIVVQRYDGTQWIDQALGATTAPPAGEPGYNPSSPITTTINFPDLLSTAARTVDCGAFRLIIGGVIKDPVFLSRPTCPPLDPNSGGGNGP